jgi:hypothetical protein
MHLALDFCVDCSFGGVGNPSSTGMFLNTSRNHFNILAQSPPSLIPALPTHAYNPPVPSRIHRQACWRGGTGADVKGKTQNLGVRVRGKWSPSGDVGRVRSCRTDFSFRFPSWSAGRACEAHRVIGAAPCGVRGFSRTRIVRRRWKTMPGGSHGLRHRSLRACMTPSPQGHATVPTTPVIAEGPKSRILTAERGAERCHLLLTLRGSFQRPVRLKSPRSPRDECVRWRPIRPPHL